MADYVHVEHTVRKACRVFGVPKLFPEQENALKAFISRKDLLLNLPTGYGKSLVFQMAPVVHEELSKHNDGFSSKPIVIVVSPLVSLMEDQVNSLMALKIKAAAIGDDKIVNSKIANGECRIVFTSPESLLGNGRRRNMLSSDIYKDNLIGIVVDEAHCISHWGTSKSQEAVAFRRWFYKLSELRSLVAKNVPFMAVTATATRKTKETIISVLRLSKFVEISESPNKANISYGVQYMMKQNSLIQYFQWILDELKEEKGSTERTIIYCQTIKQCSTLYSLFAREMDKSIFADTSEDPRKRLVEMLHALSSKANKDTVLQEMAKDDGCIRVLICTIAFGMGVNCRGVKRVIHFGPSKSVEVYIQESGRAGREGSPSKALLIYQSLMLLHVDQDMKDYVKGKYSCRRQFLMGHFEAQAGKNPTSNFTCCDLCCQDENFSIPITSAAAHTGKTRSVSSKQQKALKGELIAFRKSLWVELVQQSPKGESLPVLSIPELLIGFSNHQISQVLDNCDKIFSVSDVKNHVEIWKERHACAIVGIISEVFKDVHEGELKDLDCSNDFFDEDSDDEWNDLLNDAELLEVDLDELSETNNFADDSTCSFLDESKDFESSSFLLPELGEVIDQVQME